MKCKFEVYFMISRLSHSFKYRVTNLFESGKKYIYKRKYFSFISGCYKWIAYIPVTMKLA
jgi:hypothetical protein